MFPIFSHSKRDVLVFVAVFTLLALHNNCKPSARSNDANRIAYKAPVTPTPAADLPEYAPIELPPGSMMAIKSAGGQIANVNQLGWIEPINPGFPVTWPDIFGSNMLFPIKHEDGAIIFFSLNTLDEYFNGGNEAWLKLNNGNRIDGKPAITSIKSTGPYGEMTIAGSDINVIRFSESELSKRLATLRSGGPEYRIDMNDAKGSNVDVIFDSDHSVHLSRFGTIVSISGCDQMWIPCKRFIVYRVESGINSKQGEFKAKLPWAQISSLEEREEIKDIPSYGSTIVEAKVSIFTVKMRDGTTNEARAWREEDNRGETGYGIPHPVGFIGRDDNGTVWAFPFRSVRTITVLP